MQQLNKILVAVDLEDATESVVATAVLLARSFDASLQLLHAVPEALPDTWSDEVDRESLMGRLEEMRRGIEEQGASVHEVALLNGKASYRICQYAEQKRANLIVIGASQSGRTDVRLGVTAERVLRNSVKPVWLVAQNHGAAPSSILCPVDQSPPARRALENAIRLARQFAARLTVLRVSEAMPEVYARMIRPDDRSASQETKQLRSALTALVGEFDVAGVELDKQVRQGSPHAEILSAAAELKCDLIVMGTEGTSNQPRTLLGSVTKKVTRAMPCSVVTVNAEDVLATRLSSALAAIQEHMREGESLLRSGNPDEALAEYEQCLLDEPTYAPAWEGMAAAYQSLGDLNKADRCRGAAQTIRGAIW